MHSNYDKYPHIEVNGYDHQIFVGYKDIFDRIKQQLAVLGKEKCIVAVDCYPGVLDEEVLPALKKALNPAAVVNTLDIKHSEDTIAKMLQRNLTDDRIFGVMSFHKLDEFFDAARISDALAEITAADGLVLVYGVGASLICKPDILVYADLARWEIQQRYRDGRLDNWGAGNYTEDTLRKYKRAFFVEWRVADRHKLTLFDKIDYLLDTNIPGKPKAITGDAFREGLDKTVERPFRVVPFFDPAPWGGQWMKKVCGLDKKQENFGWCFDCVPEENSLLLRFAGVDVEIPSINVVFRNPVELLGEQVYARFGREFPIRFDLLDTMGGGNLSFQVHPLTEYIYNTFGMAYTQDESYYLLDAGKDASVYLGLKEGVDSDEMIADLRTAQKDSKQAFDADKYANRFPAARHDHFLIPAGTTHCSGAESMVLEISATPYIFTFKLWDWGRLGLDGLPRPVNIEHGKNVIQWDRTTHWVRENLVNRIEQIASGPGWTEERTGLHKREFIETRRHWFTAKVTHNTNGGVNVLNLIEGQEAIIESPSGNFEPFIVHYAETFIIPACVGEYTISPYGKSKDKRCGTIKAFVRDC
ncbi:class I mannose-6-phosphate isomerase [Lentisphaerota bacterium ZTH]|nr:class I mannose-6-phosphate isomerase [Lentisphaerota bacterium]WET05238.1 class I mannose-6-phosphate isomerase [Lentisphaerota bacterium ZTH]